MTTPIRSAKERLARVLARRPKTGFTRRELASRTGISEHSVGPRVRELINEARAVQTYARRGGQTVVVSTTNYYNA